MESYSRKIGLSFTASLMMLFDLGGMRTEFSRQWPIAADVGGIYAQYNFASGLTLTILRSSSTLSSTYHSTPLEAAYSR